MSRTGCLAVALMLLVLQGCQSLVHGSDPGSGFGSGVTPPLLPLDGDVPAVQANQRLTILRKDHDERQFVVVLAIARSKLAIHGFDELGIPLFRASYDGETVSSWVLDNAEGAVPARWLLSEIQLAYWPDELLRHSYNNGWSFSAASGERVLRFRDRRVVTVTCQLPERLQKGCFSPGSDVMIEHADEDFDIRVETITINNDVNGGERP